MGGAGEYLPCLAMVLVQMGYAGMNIVSKLAMDSGMNPFVIVTYRQIFATIAIIPFAYFLERKIWPKITKSILFQIFLCSIFGATMNQVFYFVGLKNSTPTIACALNNVLPAVTFLMAIPFKLEKVGIRERSGQAKVLGTIVCVGGAMLLSFYHGPVVGGQSGIHWKYAETTQGSDNSHGSNFFLGPFLVIASCVAWAIWFIIQARMSDKFPAPYTSSGLMCFMASIQCAVVGVAADHNPSAWALNSGIKILTTVYSGVICSALAFCLMSWCIEKKGPLYVSVFNPLLLVIVAVLSWSLLEEKLYVGTVVGSVFIIAGLYAVLWGKGNEMTDTDKNGGPKDDKQIDLELQGRLSYAHGAIRDAN